ncbi:branched-chain amino acid ABC transporter permease [Pelagibacteraceae bacterium]|nr:branched-chain amino acid ABC transporter permease [Pelagibacteraceae bacterium]
MEKFKEIIRQYPFVGFIIAFFILMAIPSIFFTDIYQSHLATLICINIIVAAGLNIVKGYCGQVTVGHVGLYAVGSYTAGCMFLYLGSGLWITLPAAIIVTALFGVVMGVPSLRLEGPYLALATLGGGEAIRLFIENGEFFGSTYGISSISQPVIFGVPFDTPDKYYFIAMPVMLISVYFSFSVLKSSVGRAFMAIREDQISAAASGINVKKYKLLAFILSAMFAGAAGAVYAHFPPGYIHPNNYTVIEMVTFLAMVVFGGLGHLWGGIIGAVIITIVYDITRPLYQYQLFIFGLTIVFTILFMPKGIGGFIDKYFIDRRFKDKKIKDKK